MKARKPKIANTASAPIPKNGLTSCSTYVTTSMPQNLHVFFIGLISQNQKNQHVAIRDGKSVDLIAVHDLRDVKEVWIS